MQFVFPLSSTLSCLANYLEIPSLGLGSPMVRPPITAPVPTREGCGCFSHPLARGGQAPEQICMSRGPQIPTEPEAVSPPRVPAEIAAQTTLPSSST